MDRQYTARRVTTRVTWSCQRAALSTPDCGFVTSCLRCSDGLNAAFPPCGNLRQGYLFATARDHAGRLRASTLRAGAKVCSGDHAWRSLEPGDAVTADAGGGGSGNQLIGVRDVQPAPGRSRQSWFWVRTPDRFHRWPATGETPKPDPSIAGGVRVPGHLARDHHVKRGAAERRHAHCSRLKATMVGTRARFPGTVAAPPPRRRYRPRNFLSHYSRPERTRLRALVDGN